MIFHFFFVYFEFCMNAGSDGGDWLAPRLLNPHTIEPTSHSYDIIQIDIKLVLRKKN